MSTKLVRFLPAVLVCSFSLAQAAQPLTAQQKQMVLDAFLSSNLASGAVQTLDSDYTPGASSQSPAAEKFAQMSTELQNAVQEKNCAVSKVDVTDPQTQVRQQSFSMTGDRCLIGFVDQSSDTPNGAETFNTSYSVLDSAYRSFTDLDSFQISGSMHMAPVGNNTFSVSMQSSGSFHSQQMGMIPLSVVMSGRFDLNGNGTMKTSFQARFPGFTAELDSIVTGSGNATQATYLLNGEALTNDEIDTYITPSFLPQSKNSRPGF